MSIGHLCFLWESVFSVCYLILNWTVWDFFLLLSCVNSLYILVINLLSDILLTNIFSHLVGCLFILLMGSFVLVWSSYTWFFAFVAFAFSVRVQASLPKPTLRSLLSMSYSSIFKKMIKKCTENINRHFYKEDTQMAKRHMKIFSKSLIIEETQIKTIKTFYLTLVKMTIIKKSTNKCWRGV